MRPMNPPEARPGLERLLATIVDDDLESARRLLASQPSLARCALESEFLLETGIFHQFYVGDTALHVAAAGYRTRLVGELVARGANPNAAGSRRRSTPLHYAADGFITGPAWKEEDQVKCLQRLVKLGASVDARDANGATPLHRAVRTRCAAATQFLLEAGSNPTLANQSGSTPFHLAVCNTGRGGSGTPRAIDAQRRIIDLFRRQGVSSSLRDGRGRTVLDAATSAWIRAALDP